jgi:hypothetical protein
MGMNDRILPLSRRSATMPLIGANVRCLNGRLYD